MCYYHFEHLEALLLLRCSRAIAKASAWRSVRINLTPRHPFVLYAPAHAIGGQHLRCTVLSISHGGALDFARAHTSQSTRGMCWKSFFTDARAPCATLLGGSRGMKCARRGVEVCRKLVPSSVQHRALIKHLRDVDARSTGRHSSASSVSSVPLQLRF
jgi:hypothetical protein